MDFIAVWYVYLALAGVVMNRPQCEVALRSRMMPGQQEMDLPIFTPEKWGPDSREFRVEFSPENLIGSADFTIHLRR